MQRKTAFPRISPTAIPRPLRLYQLSFATFDGCREPAGAFASLPLPSAFSDPFRPVDKSGGLRYDIAKIYQIQKEVLSMLPWNRGVPMGRAVTTPPTSLPQQERIILPLPRGGNAPGPGRGPRLPGPAGGRRQRRSPAHLRPGLRHRGRPGHHGIGRRRLLSGPDSPERRAGHGGGPAGIAGR